MYTNLVIEIYKYIYIYIYICINKMNTIISGDLYIELYMN